MPRSRSSQISLVDTPYYHCVSRCVRRSFLCGVDSYSGRSFEHRRDWVEKRLLHLASVYAIDICAYAVMNNHVHVVLCVDNCLADSWSLDEVLQHWHLVHKGTLLSQKYFSNDDISETEMISLSETAEVYRQRLYDISWFMRDLNEYIAREANKEDECSGRFWEGRFKSQALLDEAAVLSCMAYVDLNPIRANINKTIITSRHTSIFYRTQAFIRSKIQPSLLMPFVGSFKESKIRGLAYELRDYCELLESTRRYIRKDRAENKGILSSSILKSLGLSQKQWMTLTTEFEKHFCYAAGGEKMMQRFKHHTQHKRIRGMCNAKRLLETG
ncbi:transposase [Aliiglaciecola sp. LCG003]|uniref:transposase n=1 Tax=Aliiglaciecola sp. LCG003 TaxID=3053655 RepID=UPI002572E114|nr:transposase [Aliiglaciecola sp. LCG003]WJG07752.1 transposase [Aliiglaciecola sp. LCG003]